MTETLAHWYSPESTQRDLSNEYPQNRVNMIFIIVCGSCALEESNLSIRRVNKPKK